jgi:hypothetical protein
MTGMRQILLGVVLLSSSIFALAEPDHPRGAAVRDVPPHQQAERAPGNDRSDSHNEQHENAAGQAEADRRSGRLSLDERRELRRQINEVGRDIYRPRR